MGNFSNVERDRESNEYVSTLHFLDRAPNRLSPYTGLVVNDDFEEIGSRRRRPKPSVWSLLPPKDVRLYDPKYGLYLGPPPERECSCDKDRSYGKICPLLKLRVE